LYWHLRRPDQDKLLLLTFFLLTLAFSNHHLTLSLAFLPFLSLLLIRRKIFPDLFFSALLTAALFYLLFALLSDTSANLKTAIRFGWLTLAGFLGFLVWRKFRMDWALAVFLPLVVALGLLPYVYMPLASATNPPMNWGYTRDADGFFYSINRSQYGGSLDEQLLATVGKLVGTSGLRKTISPSDQPTREPWEPGRMEQMQQWSGFFWFRLVANFTPLALPAFFLAILLVRSAPLPQRLWLYLLLVGFFLAAFLQPFADMADIDNAGWWLQMPYHTYTFLLFSLVCLLGTAILLRILARKGQLWLPYTIALLFLLPFWPLFSNYSVCSQRDRWFGWEFGHEMLADLPEGAVVFGGTDPGRFVPTYMIFGESTVPSRWKRDPDFDRRDLFILTQNALADPYYLRYIRDHYSEERPEANSAFARWLGRNTIYPEQTLILPTQEEVREILIAAVQEDERTEIHSEIARWIFEANKDDHEFFVEESYPMKWSYDHAVPHGLVYRIAPEPIPDLPREIIRQDFAYWNALLENYLSDPLFITDFDARRSFSKLRTATGNIYKHRELFQEAELAYRQALALHPSNPDALLPLSKLLWDRNEFEDVIELWEMARADDPRSNAILFLSIIAGQRQVEQKRIDEAQALLVEQPDNAALHRKLVEKYLGVFEKEKALEVLANAVQQLPDDKDFLIYAVNLYARLGEHPDGVVAARQLTLTAPEDASAFLMLAGMELRNGNTEGFYDAARTALKIGGASARESLRSDPTFTPVRGTSEFEQLLSLGRDEIP